MGEAKVVITAEDRASGIIDHVTKRLGIFNREGVAMGISFALVTKAMELVSRGVQYLTQSFTDGINRAMDFELNLVRLTNTTDDVSMSFGQLSDSIKTMSTTYGVSANDIAVNMRLLTRQGLSLSEATKVMNQAYLVSLATGEDLPALLDALDTIMGNFNLRVSDSAYIFNELNDSFNVSKFSFTQIADIISREAPKITAAGWELEDVLNALYTLRNVATRSIGPEFVKLLEGTSTYEMEIRPGGAGKSVEEGANAAVNTTKSAVDRMGALWDGYWERVARGLFKMGTITQVALTKQLPAKTVLPGLGDITEPRKNILDWLDDIKDAAEKMPALNKEIFDMRGPIQYSESLHHAGLEVQKYQDQISALSRISRQYSIEQQQMSLDILRIQYGARGRRGGRLTRGEQKDIYNIETDMMQVQMKEQENAIRIGNIQVGGLQDALNAQDALRRQHDEEVYNEELSGLKKELDAKLVLWQDYYNKIQMMTPSGKTGSLTFKGLLPEEVVQQYQRGINNKNYVNWRLRGT